MGKQQNYLKISWSISNHHFNPLDRWQEEQHTRPALLHAHGAVGECQVAALRNVHHGHPG